jgi:hypothetical protein
MNLKNKDPFGGVHGETESSGPSPFKIDKEEALKEINRSMDIWDEKKVVKKSFLQTLREGKKKDDDNVKAPHWEYSKKSKEYVNIHLIWSKKIIRTLANVPYKQVRVALNGLKAFYSQISTIKPDLTNPDVLLCYNQTAKNYGLPEKQIYLKDQIDTEILDPFAGIHGEDLDVIFNDLSKDKTKAIKELDFSIDHFDQVDLINAKKEKKFLRKPKNYSFSYKTSTDYFNIYLYWAGKLIKSVEKVSKQRARVALVSLRGFIKSINTQNPDLKDSTIKLIYEASILKNKPKSKYIELLSIEEGGHSYWSYKTHRWVNGRFDRKSKKFVPPKKDL